ncbi:MAG: transglycosylase SLT domain-containing protein [Flavobacteriaceae bacterium]|nr:transglycosylase SLT domain-containing protein [Flavobacteriaceae bacterium]
MNKIKINLILFFLTITISYGQENDTIASKISIEEAEAIDIVNKKKYKALKFADSIDIKWNKKLLDSPQYYKTSFPIADINSMTDEIVTELSTELLKERLEVLNKQTPFNIEYNPVLERVIKHYLKTRKKYLPRIMSKSLYYFPMFEEKLDKHNLPLEIKYLSVVESALNAKARSWVGATGMWQFMYRTGKQYDLNTNSYLDERHDPKKSTEAACRYLSDLYKTFGDWDLALAAYNSGPGNVSKAIRRSGGYTNYWNIRPYLPSETAGYLPAFYATLYLFEYAQEHGLRPSTPKVQYVETDTIQVKSLITFKQLKETINIDIETLELLNPQYKLNIVPYVAKKHYAITMPTEFINRFVSNESYIYEYIKDQESKREKPLPKYFEMNQRIRYKIRSGDYLGKIASRFGVSVRSIKKWNNLKNNNLKIGKRLTIYPKRLR